MAALVERLHGAGTKLYLLSNAPNLLDPWLRGPARQRHPVPRPVSATTSSPGLVGHSKPDAAIYELVCRTGGFAPGRRCSSTTSWRTSKAREAIGMHAVHHRSPAETIRALQALGASA